MISILTGIWPIIKNIGLVIDFFKVVKSVFQSVASRDVKIPNCDETKLLIDQLRKLLDSGVIDVPGVDEKEIAGVLGQIEERLVCVVDKAQKDVAKLESAFQKERA